MATLLSGIIRTAIVGAALSWAVTCVAQNYPTKPIRLIVPFSPGGTNDLLARLVATHWTEALGKPVIVDNRAGAEGILGTEIAVKSAPDGYTLLAASSGYVMNPAVKKLPYDTLTAVDFIAKMGETFLILSVNPTLPVHTVKDLIALAGKKPGEITISTSGGFLYFASALFKSLSKRDFNIVLYKGGFPAMIDVIGGQINAHFAVSLPALPHLKSGKLRGLAVGTLKRAELFPDLPTVDEAGVKGYEASNWYALAAPAGTPRPIITRLHAEVLRYFTNPEVAKQMVAQGTIIDLKSPEEMRKYIPAEMAKWRKVAIDVGMPREN